MTEFFRYENLTWPEIEALPRDTALILPLGHGYPLDRLASVLGNPMRVGLLPVIPFGWIGSGLTVPGKVLKGLLENLLESLREDGFSRAYALIPPGLGLDLGANHITLPHPTQNTLSAPLPTDHERGKVVIIPIGHTEQHGYHLPMSTDSLIINAIGQGAALQDPEHCISLPVMPYGVSTHRSAFAGTLNCGGRAFEDFWLSIIDVLVARAFDRFYLISGHGGNTSFLVNVIKYAGERHRGIFCATSWLYLSGPVGIAALERYRESPIGGMGHACELETSLIQFLCPELVHMDRVIDEMDFVSTPSYYMDWVEGGALIANPPWDDDTRTGSYGAGSLGSPEKGRIWLEAAIFEKVTHVSEIHQQFTLRIARRQGGFGLWGKQKSAQS